MKTVWSKIKLFWKELGNFLTNLLCPIITVIIAIMEALQLPSNVIQVMKKIEYWCFYACATKEKIDKIVIEAEQKKAEKKCKCNNEQCQCESKDQCNCEDK